MKTLSLVAIKTLTLSLFVFAFASAPVFAGGNDKIEVRKTNADAYEEAVAEMAQALKETGDLRNIYSPAPQIKIYDASFNLVKEARLTENGDIDDNELLTLINHSDVLMEFQNTTYYILNN